MPQYFVGLRTDGGAEVLLGAEIARFPALPKEIGQGHQRRLLITVAGPRRRPASLGTRSSGLDQFRVAQPRPLSAARRHPAACNQKAAPIEKHIVKVRRRMFSVSMSLDQQPL